jgi:hypothetical protein
MKIKKTVSDRVIAANRSNSEKSTGPRNVSSVKRNALKHGLLAKHIVFRDQEEKTEFAAFMEGLEEDLSPNGVLEHILAEEIGTCWWKLRILLPMEMEDIRSRHVASKELLLRFISRSDDERVSVLSPDVAGTESRTAAENLAWDCQEVVLKTGSTNHDAYGDDLGESNGSSVLELRLTSALETVLRYEGSVKRDLYRAISMLQRLKSVEIAGGAMPNRSPKSWSDKSGDDFAKQSH